MKDFLQLANDRYSVRSFAEREVEQEKIDKIINAGMKAPTAVNYQPFKIWVVKSEQARSAICSCTKFDFSKGAPVIFVVGANPAQAWVRKYDNKNFADIDAAIAATQMMLEVHDLGLGTTWIGHFDEGAVKEKFPQMRDYNLIALFPVGYIAGDCVPSKMHYASKEISELVKEL